jgi:hypothetical protein
MHVAPAYTSFQVQLSASLGWHMFDKLNIPSDIR